MKLLRFVIAVLLTPLTVLFDVVFVDFEFLAWIITRQPSSLTARLWDWAAPYPRFGTPVGDLIDRLSGKLRVGIAVLVLLAIIGVFVALVVGKMSLMNLARKAA